MVNETYTQLIFLIRFTITILNLTWAGSRFCPISWRTNKMTALIPIYESLINLFALKEIGASFMLMKVYKSKFHYQSL
jgi:hypothetical protein